MNLTAGWWEVVRLTPHSYERPTFSKFGTPTGVEIVHDPANHVVGEHCKKETAQAHADKNNRQFRRKGLKYGIRRKDQ